MVADALLMIARGTGNFARFSIKLARRASRHLIFVALSFFTSHWLTHELAVLGRRGPYTLLVLVRAHVFARIRAVFVYVPTIRLRVLAVRLTDVGNVACVARQRSGVCRFRQRTSSALHSLIAIVAFPPVSWVAAACVKRVLA